jgi:hypothetical protein
MAGPGFRVEIRVDPGQALRKLDAVSVAFGRNDWLERTGDAWLKVIERTVAAKGGQRKPWPPFAPSTLLAGGGTGGATFLPGFRKTVEHSGGFATRVTVSHPDRKAYWFERGTPPKTIEAKPGRFLVFQTERGLVFTRAVKHPGQARRRLLPTKSAARAIATNIIRSSVETILKREGLDPGAN